MSAYFRRRAPVVSARCVARPVRHQQSDVDGRIPGTILLLHEDAGKAAEHDLID